MGDVEKSQKRGHPGKGTARQRYISFLHYMLDNYAGVTLKQIDKDFLGKYGLAASMQRKYPERLMKKEILFLDNGQWKVRTDLDTVRKILQEMTLIGDQVLFILSPYFEFVWKKESDNVLLRATGQTPENTEAQKILKLIFALSPTALKVALNPFFYSNSRRTVFRLKQDYKPNEEFVKAFLSKMIFIKEFDQLSREELIIIDFFIHCMVVDYFSSLTHQHFIEFYRQKYKDRWNKEYEVDWEPIRKILGTNGYEALTEDKALRMYHEEKLDYGIVRGSRQKQEGGQREG